MITNGMSSLLWFIAMIPVALWLLKRTPAGARFSGAAAGGVMRSVASLPLSASQRIVTVEVGQGDARCWLVLGVTAHGITALHTMAPQASAAITPPASAPGFADVLGKLRREPGASGGR